MLYRGEKQGKAYCGMWRLGWCKVEGLYWTIRLSLRNFALSLRTRVGLNS